MPILSEEDLERFRTKVCTLASSMKCDFGVERCNYSHNLYWARRCPFYLRDSSILRYIPQCCPDVELGEGTKVIKNTCPRGNNCSFAHSYEEIHYHPLVYKTDVCKDYRVGKCKTYYCHMIHGLAEQRQPKEYVLPKKVGLEIPEFAHVKMVDNIRSINTGNVSVGCFQKDKSGKSIEKLSSKHGDSLNSQNSEGLNKLDHKDGTVPCNLKTWSSMKWKGKGVEKDMGLSNGIGKESFVNVINNNGFGGYKEDKGNKSDKNMKDRIDGLSIRSIKSVWDKENSEESVYDWCKSISMTKIDYTDNEVNLNEIDKNYSILKTYDRQLGNTFNEFNQLNIYNHELSAYDGQFDNDLGVYGYDYSKDDKRNESLVRRNVNMWNDSNSTKIIEARDNVLGTVSSIMGDSYQSYEEMFQTSDLASSLNSINQNDCYSKIIKQCEIIKNKCRESIQNKSKWNIMVEECKKLMEIIKEEEKEIIGKK